MHILIDESDPRPIYRQVADEIRRLIAGGVLAEGEALPSVRQVAVDLGVNLNTIAGAYRELQAEGLVTIRHGSGAVVASRKTSAKDAGELRKPLQSALTALVLAGVSRDEIVSLVRRELRALTKSSR
ncbi:MAG TPA: GntR family transcriptional regulator [Thermoanaerobaculia bacterium]|nr:GntR family transcriptional regulator [Thermoanaerobaculia bacterium]